VPQADALDSMLQGRGQRLDIAVRLAVPEEELVRRLGARRECPVCKRAYNLDTAAPKDGRHCDDHPGVELIQRIDDAEGTIRRRLEVYRTETEPLIDYYRGQGRLREIPGLGAMDDVYRSLTQVLGCRA
jgi:adenylate kinase